MNDPIVARMLGACVFSALLLAVVVEGERASEPVKAAEDVVAMIRDGLKDAITQP